jgi:hypothetical protein
MNTSNALKMLLAVGLAATALATAAACGDDSAVTEPVTNRDAGVTVDGSTITPGTDGSITPGMDGSITPGPDGSVPDDCVMNPDPSVYTDILNACTTSYKIDPHPVLPLLYTDGGLPPLP